MLAEFRSIGQRDIDDGLALNQLALWAPSAAIRRKILVDNPARLYDF